MYAIRARRKQITEKDMLEAINKVIKGYAKFSATPKVSRPSVLCMPPHPMPRACAAVAAASLGVCQPLLPLKRTLSMLTRILTIGSAVHGVQLESDQTEMRR